MKLIKLVKLLSMLMISIFFTSQTAFANLNNLSVSVVPSEVQFQLIDPYGNITGYDPITKSILENIPNTLYELHQPSYSDNTIPGKFEKGFAIENIHYGSDAQVAVGVYKIKLFGSPTQENYSIEIKAFAYLSRNPIINYYDPKRLIYPNVTWTYEFAIPVNPPANGQLVLVKVSDPNELITDITAAGNLGYIGNAKFVSELIKEVQEIEKERTEVQKQNDKDKEHLTPAQKAIKEYKELLKEITEKYQRPEADEFIKQEAYTVLKEDLDYIIGHI